VHPEENPIVILFLAIIWRFPDPIYYLTNVNRDYVMRMDYGKMISDSFEYAKDGSMPRMD